MSSTARMNGDSKRVLSLVFAMVLYVVLGAAAGCASLKGHDPLQVTVAGIEPLQGQGMELRLLVKLRIQNPNDDPIDYRGVATEMIVQGKTFATGVSDAQGSVPGFGEAVIEVPVTASAFSLLGQALGVVRSGGSLPSKISYELKGKLSGSSTTRFHTKGDFDLPTGAASGT